MAEVEGLRESLGNMNKYLKDIADATPASLKKGGLYLQRESQLEVPVRTSVLKNSAFTRAINASTVNVGYGTAYGIYVHEMTHLKHSIGKAKFLTGPMKSKSSDIVRIIANDLSKVKPRR